MTMGIRGWPIPFVLNHHAPNRVIQNLNGKRHIRNADSFIVPVTQLKEPGAGFVTHWNVAVDVDIYVSEKARIRSPCLHIRNDGRIGFEPACRLSEYIEQIRFVIELNTGAKRPRQLDFDTGANRTADLIHERGFARARQRPP